MKKLFYLVIYLILCQGCASLKTIEANSEVEVVAPYDNGYMKACVIKKAVSQEYFDLYLLRRDNGALINKRRHDFMMTGNKCKITVKRLGLE